MDKLYTNRTSHADFTSKAFTRFGKDCDVLIASAFFSNEELVTALIGNNCRVHLIVRVGPGTSSSSLAKVSKLTGVQVRYFNDESFHPKLYIFGSQAALVGSSNLTKSGMGSNQEVSVVIDGEDPRFDELGELFWSYWSQAKVLTDDDLRKIQSVEYQHRTEGNHKYEQDIYKTLGRHPFQNIERGDGKTSAVVGYVDGYRRRYQTFLGAFDVVYRIYKQDGRRLVPENVVPLRFEVDQLLSYIREVHAKGDSFKSVPLLHGSDQEQLVKKYIDGFISEGWTYLTDKLANHLLPMVRSTLGTKDLISKASIEDIYQALLCINAFRERARYFGGEPEMHETFLKDNNPARVKRTLNYLLHEGSTDYVERMANCIFSPAHRLDHFGEGCVQETFGWVNSQQVPICNGRTLKSLRFLGFNVPAV